MSWYSIREYTQRMNVSASTVRRQIAGGKLYAKKFGRHWYVQSTTVPPDHDPAWDATGDETEQTAGPLAMRAAPSGGDLAHVVEFSSKALHHYLMLSEKLIAEKDLRLKEKDEQLSASKQESAELEAYVRILENELERQKEKPEGWR